MTIVETVVVTRKNNLCISCGLCKAICPEKCISYKRENGLYQPKIDTNHCIRCGRCYAICPGAQFLYKVDNGINTGNKHIISSYNSWAKNEEIRFQSASGGTVTTIINMLLKNNIYDIAFCLDTYKYSNQLMTKPFSYEEYKSSINDHKIQKSRYLPVSHEKALEYIKINKKDRVVFIAAPCAIKGLKNAIRNMNYKESNYLFIGLFCDKVFNYNIFQYYEEKFCASASLEQLHFKNKERGGWPGDMKFFLSNGDCFFKSKQERTKMKDYFMPERCLFCIDKLNGDADLSIGDNYTESHSSKKGSNSVIIRTQKGLEAWNAAVNQLEFYRVALKDIEAAQYLNERLENIHYANLKRLQVYKKKGVEIETNTDLNNYKSDLIYEYAFYSRVRKLKVGAIYKNAHYVDKQIYRINHPDIKMKLAMYLKKIECLIHRNKIHVRGL